MNGAGTSALVEESAASNGLGSGFEARVHGISLSVWQQHPWLDRSCVMAPLWSDMDGP